MEIPKLFCMEMPKLLILGIVAGFCCGAGAAEALPPAAALHTLVKRDLEPVPREMAAARGYADVVETVRDSVVTIEIKHRHAPKPHQEGAKPANDLDIVPGEGEREPDKDPEEEGPDGSGTGIVITADGLILTNNHVVQGADEIAIRLRDQEETFKATVVGRDPSSDVAVIKAATGKLSPAVLGDNRTLRPGDVVLAMGSPFGLEQTVTMGIVSATGRAVGFTGTEDFIQTDAAINPGNSGGPLMDCKGRVVGINTAGRQGTGIGFAVPVNLALKVADDLLLHGMVVRGTLGIRMTDLTPALAAEIGLAKGKKGVVVTRVEAGHAAAHAGFRPRDLIVQVNGRRIRDEKQLRLSMTSLEPGAQARFVVMRETAEMELTATLEDPPELIKARQEAKTGDVWEIVPGLHASLITPALRERFPLPERTQGVVVTEDYTPAGSDKPVLAAGDLITSVNGTPLDKRGAIRETFARMKQRMLMLKIVSQGKERFQAVQQQ